jgi:hypothetical protein
MVAEFLDCAGSKCHENGLFDGADLFAFVASDARLHFDRIRTGKAMVSAVRTLPDRAKNEIGCHETPCESSMRQHTRIATSALVG